MRAAPEDVLQTALHALPGRSLTDELVRHYLHDGNMQYYSIHPPSFMSAYEHFWGARARPTDQPSPAFTCLLLQVCSNASQRLEGPLKQRLQYDLAEDNAQTSKRLFHAADDLSRATPPGIGNVEKVLQLLLAAAWLKSEGRIVDGWHALSNAVREAQECGMGHDEMSDSSDRMEVEVRRRVWCSIVIWDWQMAEWLSRPMLIKVDCDMPHPNPLVDGNNDGHPSPISNLSHQFRLVQALGSRYGRLSEIREHHAIQEVLDTIEEWRHELPPELSRKSPNLSWDDQCSWLPLQRAQLHSFAEMVRLTPLKHILISPAKMSAGKHLLCSAVQACVDSVDAALVLAGVMGPMKMAFHFVIFALFDTSTLICSAIMHEHGQGLPQRDHLLYLVKQALAALAAMSKDSVSARRSTAILRWLLGRLGSITGESFASHAPELSPRKELFPSVATSPTLKGTRVEQEPVQQHQFLPKRLSSEQAGSVSSDAKLPADALPQTQVGLSDSNGETNDDAISWLWTGDFSAQGLTDFDIGGMESIWDWEALDIGSAF